MSEDAARAWTWLEALHVLRRCDPEAVTRKACEYRAFVDESPCSTPAEEEVRDQIALDVARTQVRIGMQTGPIHTGMDRSLASWFDCWLDCRLGCPDARAHSFVLVGRPVVLS